jgi:hypothetical protein
MSCRHFASAEHRAHWEAKRERRRQHWAEMRERRREARRGRHNPLIGGLMLMVVGIVLLLEMQNVYMGDVRLGFETLWPLFLIAAGPGMLLGFLIGGLKHPERVASGVTTALIGWFFLAITLGPLELTQLARLWPAFPLAAGIGSFAGWLSSLGRQLALLRSGLIGMAVGVVGFAFTLTPIGSALFAAGWPALLVVLGLALLLKGALGAVFRVFSTRGASAG